MEWPFQFKIMIESLTIKLKLKVNFISVLKCMKKKITFWATENGIWNGTGRVPCLCAERISSDPSGCGQNPAARGATSPSRVHDYLAKNRASPEKTC